MKGKYRRLRIFMFTYWHDKRFKHIQGGPIKFWELSDNLTKLGHRVILFVPKFGKPKDQTTAEVIEIPFIDVPFFRFLSFQLSCFIVSLVKVLKVSPDIIYVRIMWSFLPMLLAKVVSAPTILEVNDDPYRGYESVGVVKKFIVRLINRLSFLLSERVLPVTEGVGRRLYEVDNVHPEKTIVIQSGANTSLYKPLNKYNCQKSLGLDGLKYCVGFVGNFFEHQGVGVLIDAAPFIASKFNNVRFLIVGDGPMKSRWMNEVSQKGLSEYFIFPGWIAYTEVPKYIGTMDICVAPLLRSAGEASAVKVFDYLACGRPVVMSDIEATGRFFLQSGAVRLVSPENPDELAGAIISLLEDEEMRDVMGEKGREFVERNFNRLAIAKKVIDISYELLRVGRCKYDVMSK